MSARAAHIPITPVPEPASKTRRGRGREAAALSSSIREKTLRRSRVPRSMSAELKSPREREKRKSMPRNRKRASLLL
jgi:hypothetical protein